MASITWPTLPLPLQDGYGESPPDNVLRWKPDYGPDILRRRSTAASRPLDLRYHLTLAEANVLDTFYITTCLGGTARFNFTHPRTQVVVEARFLTPPDYSSLQHDMIATVRLEILP